MTMFDLATAEKLGWTLKTDGSFGDAVGKDGYHVEVYSGTPVFALVKEIAALEGQPLPTPYTAAMIAAVSGEVYAEPLPPPKPVTVAPVNVRVADVLRPIAAQPAGTPVTCDQLVAVIAALAS